MVHRLGKRDDLGRTLDLDPLAEEPVGERAHGDPRVSPGVPGLGRALARADDRVTLVVDADQHRRHLRPSVGVPGEQDGVVVAGQIATRLVEIHHTMMRARAE
ncbi:hypothetical protein GCM10020219_093980 [Nonomuraea dietziae]